MDPLDDIVFDPGQDRALFGRFTPKDEKEFSLDILDKFFKDAVKSKKFVICEERSKIGVYHFHFIIYTLDTIQCIRARLLKFLKGKGELYFSKKPVQDQTRAIAYVIKDGSYRSNNIDVGTMLTAKKVSYKKKVFRDEYKRILDDYSSHLTDEYFVNDLINLYIEFHKPLNLAQITNCCILAKARIDSTYKNQVVRNVMSRMKINNF